MTVRFQKMSTALQNKWRVPSFTICQSLLNGSQERRFRLVENMPSQTPGVWWTMETTIHRRQECASQRQEHTGAGIRKTCMWKSSVRPQSSHNSKAKIWRKAWVWVHKQLLGPKTVTQPKWNKVCNFCDRQELTWLMIKKLPKAQEQMAMMQQENG